MSTITLPERLTLDNANAIAKQLDDSVERRVQGATLDIDLSNVTHCDSAGVAALIEAKRHAKQKDCHITYRNIPPQLHDLADFLKVKEILCR